jgi:hypothetical protein
VEGDAADKPPLPAWPKGWQLGEPDLVVEMPEAYVLPANGADVFRNFVIPVPSFSTRYVKAMEFRTDNLWNAFWMLALLILFDASSRSGKGRRRA